MSFSLESLFKDPTALFEKSRGISPVLEACPISDALITQNPADEEPLCRNSIVYAVIIFIIIIKMVALQFCLVTYR